MTIDVENLQKEIDALEEDDGNIFTQIISILVILLVLGGLTYFIYSLYAQYDEPETCSNVYRKVYEDKHLADRMYLELNCFEKGEIGSNTYYILCCSDKDVVYNK